MDIKDKLKYIRKSKNLSQNDIAEKLCKSPEYIDAIESGKEELKPLIFLNFCEVLDVNPIEFLNDSAEI